MIRSQAILRVFRVASDAVTVLTELFRSGRGISPTSNVSVTYQSLIKIWLADKTGTR
jgi:hypothetical protein